MLFADIGFIVIGVVLCAASRMVADSFRIPGSRSTFVKMGGLGDDYVSRLYRWFVCVLTGLVFIGIGLIDLVSR